MNQYEWDKKNALKILIAATALFYFFGWWGFPIWFVLSLFNLN